MNITPIESNYHRIIEILIYRSDFIKSQEYKMLLGTAEDLPGVVSCAYSNFIERMIKEYAPDVKDLMKPINEFASWKDSRVNEMLQDEVFEQLADDRVYTKIAHHMSNELRYLFIRWSKNRRNSADRSENS